MNIDEIDNKADTVINLRISGNRLVRVLNAMQALMHETKRLKYDDAKDRYVGTTPWYDELNDIVERMRDQLSEQRMAARDRGLRAAHDTAQEEA